MLSETAQMEVAIKLKEALEANKLEDASRRDRITFLEQLLCDTRSVLQMERAIENLERILNAERERMDRLRIELTEARIAIKQQELPPNVTNASLTIEFYKLPASYGSTHDGTLFIPLPKSLQVPIPCRYDESGEKCSACCCEVCKFFATHEQERKACGYVESWDTLVVGLEKPSSSRAAKTIAAGMTTTCHFPAINNEYLSLLPSEIVKAAFDSFK